MTPPRKPTATERGVAIVLATALAGVLVVLSGWCLWTGLPILFRYREPKVAFDHVTEFASFMILFLGGICGAFGTTVFMIGHGIPWLHWALTAPVAKSAETFDGIDEGRL